MAVAAIALLALLVGLGLLALRRRLLGPLSLWVWGWVVFFAISLALGLAPESPAFSYLALVLGPVFPAALVAGAGLYAGRPRWQAWLPAALFLGAAGALLAPRIGTAPVEGLHAAFAVGLILAAGYLVRRDGRTPPEERELPERVLPGVFVGLAALAAADHLGRASGADRAGVAAAWLVAAPAAGLVQLMAVTDRVRRERARRDGLRHQAEQALAATREELEQRVARRTHALSTANQDLARQVAEREAAEHRLRESEERYRRATGLSSDYSYAVRVAPDGGWQLLWLTGAFPRVTGLTRAELEGGWLRHVLPDDLPAVQRRYEAVLAGLDGEQEFRIIGKDGSVRWLHERLSSELDPASGDVVIYGAAHDISARKQAEEEREFLQARLREAQRLESLGAMARGVAHDFNKLLTPILGHATAGLADAPPGSPLRARLESIRQAAEYAAALVAQMLAYGGEGTRARAPVDLSGLVREMLPLLRSAAASRARLEAELAPSLPPLEGDAMQIRQVMVNLVTNAAEALRSEGGTVWVRTGVMEADARLLERAVPGAPSEGGRFVLLEVEDDGVGLDEEAREHLFQPFFTTKREGRGLGLAAVLGIVRGHDGAILVDGAPGQGTRFRILLPLAARAKEREAAAKTGAQRPRTQPVRLLLVDDDEAVAEVAREFLSRAGFQVDVAYSGDAGLARFRGTPAAYAGVVLDWTMPGLDGKALLEEIRRLEPGMPVVVASGLDPRGALGPAGPAPGAPSAHTGFLRKPFAPEALVGAVRLALDAARPDAGTGPPAQDASADGRSGGP